MVGYGFGVYFQVFGYFVQGQVMCEQVEDFEFVMGQFV